MTVSVEHLGSNVAAGSGGALTPGTHALPDEGVCVVGEGGGYE